MQDDDGIRDMDYLNNSETETCMGDTIPSDNREKLRQRAAKIEELSKNHPENIYQRAVFVHLDSRDDETIRIDMYFMHHEKCAKSKQFAQRMRDNIEYQYKTNRPDRKKYTGEAKPPRGGLFVLNYLYENTTIPALFAELCNIRNVYDQQRYIPYQNRQVMVDWMTEGFVSDYKKEKQKK